MQKLKIKFNSKPGVVQRAVSVLVVCGVVVGLAAGGYFYFMEPDKPVEPIDISAMVPAKSAASSPQLNAPMSPPSGLPMAASSATSPMAVPATSPASGAAVSAPAPLSPMAAGIQAAMAPASAASSPASAANVLSVKVPSGQADPTAFAAIGQLVKFEVERSALLSKIEAAKLKAELMKANADIFPAEPKPDAEVKKKAAEKKVNLIVPPEPVNTDQVELLSVVGRPGQERAEVSINGIVVTTGKQVRLGSYFVNNIDSKCVYMTDRLDKPMNRCILP